MERKGRAKVNIVKNLCFAALSAFLVIAACGTVWAGSGNVIIMPQPPNKPKNGLRISIDTRWVDANGYRPVRIVLLNSPPGPTIADRNFRIEIEPTTWQRGYGVQRVSGYVEMPEGASSAEAVLSVPQCLGWSSIRVRTYEDGYELEDLATSYGIPVRSNYEWSEAVPAVLFIDSDAPTPDDREAIIRRLRSQGSRDNGGDAKNTLPDIRHIAGYYANTPYFGNFNVGNNRAMDDDDLLRVVEDLPKVEILPPAWLPSKWIDYTCFDVIFISLADLQQMSKADPDALDALRHWAAAGQTLCVYGVAQTPERLNELNRLLQLPVVDEKDEEADDPAVIAGWSRAQHANAVFEIRGMREVLSNRISYSTRSNQSGPSPDPFGVRRTGVGQVFAIPTDQPLASETQTAWIFNEIARLNWAWYQRHGFSFHRENADYWNWMIPGIGRAPVNSYLVLISLFVVVIGPVNYYLLKRRKRLYMLLVTVPLGAGFVTFILLNYALISDGLGVRVRVRSFTDIDQRTGQTASWSRQTYYAGLAPSRGLKFPTSAAVYPIEQFPPSYREQRSNRRIVWDEGQNLVSGYVNSRSSSQFAVIQASTTKRGLAIQIAEGNGAALSVTNNLGAPLKALLISDDEGNLYFAENLGDAATQQLEPSDANLASTRIRQLYNESQPAVPPGYDSRYYRNNFGYRRRYSSYGRNDNNLPGPAFGQGLMERNIYQSLLSNFSSMPPRTYLAIAGQCPEVPFGYKYAREEASFHVIRGHW